MWKAIWAAILEFFKQYSKPKDEDINVQKIQNKDHLEEVDDKVENASNDELVELAIDSGLVQRPVDTSGVSNGSIDKS